MASQRSFVRAGILLVCALALQNGGVRGAEELYLDAVQLVDDDSIAADEGDDELLDDNGVEFVDQRQNGTENYRIRVNGLLLIITPPEVPMPTPTSSDVPLPLTPPTPVPASNLTTAAPSLSGVKQRFNMRRHGQAFIEQQKLKLSRYQARIPQFIMAILRNRHVFQQNNH